jgi:hypothetical protein
MQAADWEGAPERETTSTYFYSTGKIPNRGEELDYYPLKGRKGKTDWGGCGALQIGLIRKI